jgi:hypothetical protein
MRAPILIAIGLLLSGATGASALDVTACGQTVPAGETGVLQGDLDCATSSGSCFLFPTDPQPEPNAACSSDDECGGGVHSGTGFCARAGVLLERRATLQMNGHTLSGAGVRCDGPCSVSGPGEIVASNGFGIEGTRNVRVRGVTVRDASYAGIWSLRGNVDADGVVVRNVPSMGIHAPRGKVRVKNSNVQSGNVAVAARRGIEGSALVASDSHFGVVAERIKLTGLEAKNNVRQGLSGKNVVLQDSVVTGNDAGFDGYDIWLLGLHPHLRAANVTCGRSNAGICAND